MVDEEWDHLTYDQCSNRRCHSQQCPSFKLSKLCRIATALATSEASTAILSNWLIMCLSYVDVNEIILSWNFVQHMIFVVGICLAYATLFMCAIQHSIVGEALTPRSQLKPTNS